MIHARILRYLDEVVRAGSIRKAAKRLGIASSSISRQIVEIEDQLGAPLFQRLPGKLRLTAAGELLIAHIRQTLKDYEKVAGQIEELKGGGRGTVRIATMNGLAGSLVPSLALSFAKTYPGVNFLVRTLVTGGIVQAVKAGEVDFGMGYNLPQDPDLRVIEELPMRLGAIMAPNHPLARQSGVRLAECAIYNIILSDASLSIRALIHTAAQKGRVAIDTTLETNSIDLMKRSVLAGDAISFLSAPDVAEEVRQGQLVFMPILDKALVTHTLVLVQRANAVLDRSPSLFVETLRGVLHELRT